MHLDARDRCQERNRDTVSVKQSLFRRRCIAMSLDELPEVGSLNQQSCNTIQCHAMDEAVRTGLVESLRETKL